MMNHIVQLTYMILYTHYSFGDFICFCCIAWTLITQNVIKFNFKTSRATGKNYQ